MTLQYDNIKIIIGGVPAQSNSINLGEGGKVELLWLYLIKVTAGNLSNSSFIPIERLSCPTQRTKSSDNIVVGEL